jgi:hypothetical protein
MQYKLTTPCAKCPFRTDIEPYIRKARIADIERGLERGQFPCHQTFEHDDDGGYRDTDAVQHCAGALILMEKLERSSQMMRIMERIGAYDHRKLNMDAPVFDSFEDMEDAQKF